MIGLNQMKQRCDKLVDEKDDMMAIIERKDDTIN